MVTLQKLNVLNRTLVIGRRWNVWWQNLTLYLPEQVTHVAHTFGKLHIRSAVDYFIIAKNEFPWHRLPDVVIARRGYDNYLVMLAVRERVSVVDITNTLVAAHQTDTETMDRRRHFVDHEFNMQHLPPFNYTDGWTSSSQYLTNLARDRLHNLTSIVIWRRQYAI